MTSRCLGTREGPTKVRRLVLPASEARWRHRRLDHQPDHLLAAVERALVRGRSSYLCSLATPAVLVRQARRGPSSD